MINALLLIFSLLWAAPLFGAQSSTSVVPTTCPGGEAVTAIDARGAVTCGTVSAADDQTAAEVPFTPAGSIEAVEVQAAIEELDAALTALPAFTLDTAYTNGGRIGGAVSPATAVEICDDDAGTNCKIQYWDAALGWIEDFVPAVLSRRTYIPTDGTWCLYDTEGAACALTVDPDADGSAGVGTITVAPGMRLIGGVRTLHVFKAQEAELPAASFATFDTRNSRPILLFVDAADTSAQFSGIFNRGYTASGAISVDIHYMMPTVTTSTVGWCARIEASVAQDQDSNGFVAKAAGHCVSSTVPGTAGLVGIATVALTNIEADAIAPGGEFVLEISRDGAGALVTDGATETAQLRMVEVRQ